VIASEFILKDISPLSHINSVQDALLWMEELKVKHCPIVNNEHFVGLLSEKDALERLDNLSPISSILNHLQHHKVWEYEHLYDMLAKIGEFQLSVIPILSRNEQYLGSTTTHHIMHHISTSTTIQEKGGIIVLEMNQHDYSMSQIAQIVESNQAKIVSLSVVSIPYSTKIEVTLKLNELDIERIIQTFIRFDYNIKAIYQESSLTDNLQNRFESFMNMLNI